MPQMRVVDRLWWLVLIAPLVFTCLPISVAPAQEATKPPIGFALAQEETKLPIMWLDKNQSFIVIILTIGLMVILFICLFVWNNKLEQSNYLGRIYKDSIENIEFNRNVATINADWDRGRYREELLFYILIEQISGEELRGTIGQH